MERIVIAVSRRARPSEKLLRGAMAALAALFLILGIALNRGLMLPCFLMAVAYFIYTNASRRAWEYIIENGVMRIDRMTDHGRVPLHEFSLRETVALALPDDPGVAKYKKGGEIKVKKYDYTSYADGVTWYTMIIRENGREIKLLLDLNDQAVDAVRRENREAVMVPKRNGRA